MAKMINPGWQKEEEIKSEIFALINKWHESNDEEEKAEIMCQIADKRNELNQARAEGDAWFLNLHKM
jgi:hypothetical protein